MRQLVASDPVLLLARLFEFGVGFLVAGAYHSHLADQGAGGIPHFVLKRDIAVERLWLVAQGS